MGPVSTLLDSSPLCRVAQRPPVSGLSVLHGLAVGQPRARAARGPPGLGSRLEEYGTFVRDIFAHGEHPLARESGEAVLFGGAQDHSSIITVSPLALVPAFVCCA